MKNEAKHRRDAIRTVLAGEGKNGMPPLRHLFQQIMLEGLLERISREVEALCGHFYGRGKETPYVRAGSARGKVYVDGVMTPIKRPRVRRRGGREAELQTYCTTSDNCLVMEDVLRAIAAGVSSRDVHTLWSRSSKGVSASTASRYWMQYGMRYFEELRNRTFDHPFVVVMIDGIVLSEEETALVALGVDATGAKTMLDFEVGRKESAEVCAALLQRLTERGVTFGGDPFFVLDGSKALEKSVRHHHGEKTLIQRCLVHKERNLRRYLARKDWAELARLMKRLRLVEGAENARMALLELRNFVARKNRQALESVEEAGEQLITLHLLNVPATLHPSLLSTNLIENSFLNLRRKTRRVTRSRAQTDMAHRWVSYAMLTAEAGFRSIRGCQDLPALMKALHWKEHPQKKVA